MPDGPVKTARSVLLVPGSDPARFGPAAASEADLLVLDLADGVPEAGKVEARRAVSTWLLAGHQAAVRVNPVTYPQHPHDVAALSYLPGLMAVVVPQTEDPGELGRLHTELGGRVPLVAIIETAVGLSRLNGIAGVEGVQRLVFGHLAYSVDIGASDDPLAMLFARSQIVNASRAACLAGPVDGVTTDVREPEVALGDAKQSRRLGFTGKVCFHQHQVEAINEAFLPSVAEIDWAHAVVEAASEGGVALLNGHLVEPALVDRARRILALIDF